jgi:gamma-glutamyltranspeptidase / glutathione hydrolase
VRIVPSRLTAARSLALVLTAGVVAGGCQSASSSQTSSAGAPNDAVASYDPAIPERRPANFPPGWRFTAGDSGTFARSSMIASNSVLASRAGDEILAAGGNAVDAAVAVGFALAVTWPSAGNLGGGGYMVIRMADGRTAAIDYREIAPAASSRNMYLDASGKLTDKSVVGYLASGVPGAVAGMAAALERYGSKPLREVIAPAIRLADDGFVVDSALFRSLQGSDSLIKQFGGAGLFFPGGQQIAIGARLRQPQLAQTLRRIAEQGAAGFYTGPVADSIEAGMKRGGGIITKADLAGYKPIWREPIKTTYRGYTMFTMPPSSSGGVTMSETLNILETYDSLPSFGTTHYATVLGSAYQRAFIDRNVKLGDPEFIKVPIAELTDKNYAKRLRATIDAEKWTPTPVVEKAVAEGSHTTHYSAVDKSGNAVATTTTLNNSYGSGVYLPGVGIFMNDEMDDFAAQPGKPNMFGLVQGEQNAIAPGKRMLSAMSPTIVLDPKDQLLLVVGAAGGPRIITATSQVILNVIDHRMSLPDAMRAPRMHHQALPDSLRMEKNGFAGPVADSLRAAGVPLSMPGGSAANVNGIMRVKGGWVGVSEPRNIGNGAVGR